MTKNVGSTDKILRLIVGAVLVILPLFTGMTVFESPAMTIASLLVGAVLIGTALFNFCPLYRLLGIRTCKV